MPTNITNTTNSYAESKNLRLPFTQFIDNQCHLEPTRPVTSKGAVLLRLIAFLFFLFCTSPNNRQPIWTPPTQDQQIPSLHIPLYTCTWPFPATIANSHTTFRAEENVFHPHLSPILSNPSIMNTNSYALAMSGASLKTGRKASKISESPARQAGLSTAE